MPEDITVAMVDATTEEYGAQIPEHAIIRLAGFFLKKMQQEAEKKEE